MELVIFDQNMEEIGPVDLDVDFEIGDVDASNDFEITENKYPEAYGIYVPGTELGGLIEKDIIDDIARSQGFTWRGLLTQCILFPPAGSDYLTVYGYANDILRYLFETTLGGFFKVKDVPSAYITSYRFKLYTTYLEGITDMLAQYGQKLKIYAEKDDQRKKVVVYCEAVPIETIEGEFNEDSEVQLRFTDDRMGVTHLVCLGRGELQERERIDLYVDGNGNVGFERYYAGIHERTQIYENTSAESYDELLRGGIKRLNEIRRKRYLDIISSPDLEIGDLVRGRKRDSNLLVELPVNRRVVKISGDNVEMQTYVKD